MEEPKIIIKTSITEEDYRKFLYIATFKRSKFIIPFMIIISLIGGLAISFNNGQINLFILIISWVSLFALSFIVIIFKVERKNKQRIKTDKTGTFDSINTLSFFEDKVVMENESIQSTGQLNYDQFYALLESKDYFFFYINVNQASLIRKVDIPDLNEFKKFIIGKFEGRYKKI